MDYQLIKESLDYQSIKESLENFHQQFGAGRSSFAHHLFYQCSDIVKCDNIHFYVVCQKSYGNGDVVNAIKTFHILKKYFKNVELLVKNSTDYDSVMALDKNLITDIIHLKTLINLDETKLLEKKKIFIVCALSINEERFSEISGEKKFLFIDEYNGWRIKHVEEKQEETDSDSESESDDNVPKKHECMKCDSCLQKENYEAYELVGIDHDKKGNFHVSSSGIGKTYHDIPTIGVHITTDEIIEPKNDVLKHYINKMDRKYYFAYFSSINGHNQIDNTIKYLELFYATMKRLKSYKEKTANFIIVDPTGYLYKQRKLCFVNNDRIKINGDFYYIKNKHEKTKMLYTNGVDRSTMMYLIKNSDPCIFLSGDQSFMEGISMYYFNATKIIFYQMQEWKTNFISEYLKLCKSILPDNSPLLKFQQKAYDKELSIHQSGELFYLISDKRGELLENSATVCKYIIDNYNIEKNLISICVTLLLEDTTTVSMIKNMLALNSDGSDFEIEYSVFQSYLFRKCGISNKRKIVEVDDAEETSGKKAKSNESNSSEAGSD